METNHAVQVPLLWMHQKVRLRHRLAHLYWLDCHAARDDGRPAAKHERVELSELRRRRGHLGKRVARGFFLAAFVTC